MKYDLSMNSIEISEALIRELDSRIETLRKFEANKLRNIDDICDKIDELNVTIDNLLVEKDKANDALDHIRARKKSLLINKQALMEFIKSGGGLDMFV